MKKVTFNVVGSNPSNGGKTFVWKLEVYTDVTCFGITKNVKRTYYIGGMPVEAKIGDKMEEDMNKFEITERAFDTPSGEKIMLKWLHAKV